jgi:LAO/AO transport system kinase
MPHWTVPVATCSALEGTGIAEAWETIGRFRSRMTDAGEISAARASQARAWLWSEMAESLLESLREDPEMRRRVAAIESAVAEGRSAPRVAAQELVAIFLHEGKP